MFVIATVFLHKYSFTQLTQFIPLLTKSQRLILPSALWSQSIPSQCISLRLIVSLSCTCDTYCYTNNYANYIRWGLQLVKLLMQFMVRRSQWPRGLRRESAGSRLVGLRVRIPPEGMGVCRLWVLCVVQVEASATDRSLVHRNLCVCVCVCVCMCHWVRSDATVTLYTCNV